MSNNIFSGIVCTGIALDNTNTNTVILEFPNTKFEF